jgi:phosphoglycerol transferase
VNKFTKLILSALLALFHFTTTLVVMNAMTLPLSKKTLFAIRPDVNTRKALTLGLLIGLLLLGFAKLVNRFILTKQAPRMKTRYLIEYVVGFFLTFLGALAGLGIYWVRHRFSGTGLEEIIYTMSQPLTGSDSGQITSFLQGPLLNAGFLASSASLLLLLFHLIIIKVRANSDAQPKTFKNVLKALVIPLISLVSLAGGLAFGVHQFGFTEVNNYFFVRSSLYEKHYTDPKTVKTTFPKKKRNLIYIYLESMESSYASTDIGGSQTENLIPSLSNLALNDGVNFSNTDLLGGAQPTPGTGFTVGGMVAQTSGIPLKVNGYNENEYGNTASFLPGAYSIGDILDKAGYNQTLMIGSDAAFSGRDKLFSQHGNYTIKDYNYANEHGWFEKDRKVWWGYEDTKLVEYAKNEISKLATKEAPFNFTMLTADTHFPGGYSTDETPKLFDDQYSNVIHYSDQMIGELIEWIQAQSFYDNTTIVVSGDHTTMDTDFVTNKIPTDYTRTVFNMFLNSGVEPKKYHNRIFSTMDMYPSTLAAMGVKISGNRLGLGTNLFSSKETLEEQLGYEAFCTALGQRSDYYEDVIMAGSDTQNSSSN